MSTRTVYIFCSETFEYKEAYNAQESPLEPGEFITPIHSTPKPPPTTEDNQAAVFSVDSDAWSVVADFRGQTFYDQATGAATAIETLGAVPANFCLTPPPLSAEKLQAQALGQRDALLATAAIRIAPLQDVVDLTIATAEEESALTAWKQYRVALNRIEQQTGFPHSIDWPVPPA